VGNFGDADSGACNVSLYVDDVFRQSWDWIALQANHYTTTEDWNLGTLSAGVHTIRLEADSNDANQESDESNNTYTKMITVDTIDGPDLAPYQPEGWDAPLIVSVTTETSTDATEITTNDEIFIDFAVGNFGDVDSGNYIVSLYVDDLFQNSWGRNALEANFYSTVEDWDLGSLAAGTHTLRLVADSDDTNLESDETNNTYTKIITIDALNGPDLAPYQPEGWDAPLITSVTTETNTDAAQITTNDEIFIDFAVGNFGDVDSGTYVVSLYVDDFFNNSWDRIDLDSNYFTRLYDWNLGTLVAGTHTLRLEIDSDNTNQESDESNNSYTKTIDILPFDITNPSVPSELSQNVVWDDVELDWDDSTDAFGIKEYVIEYSENADMSGALSATTVNSAFNLINLNEGAWHWRVSALDNNDNQSDWSAHNNFFIDTQPPSVPNGLDVISNADGDIVFDWNDSNDNISGIDEYTVQSADNADFTGATLQTVTDSEWNRGMLPADAYYWRVKASDNAGNQSGWSNVSSMVIDYIGDIITDPTLINVETPYISHEYVGLGDVVDYYSFELADGIAGIFDFSLTELSSKTIMTLYTYDPVKVKYTRVDSASAKTDKLTGETVALCENVLLETGTYYVEILSVDNGKYSLEINPDYFPLKSDDEFNFKTGTGTPAALDINIGASDWVGFGDSQDVYQFDVAAAGLFDFALNNLEAKISFAVYSLVKGKYKAIKKASVKADKTTGEFVAVINDALLDTGTYYVEIMAGKKGNTPYDLDINADPFPAATDNNTWDVAISIDPAVNIDGLILSFD